MLTQTKMFQPYQVSPCVNPIYEISNTTFDVERFDETSLKISVSTIGDTCRDKFLQMVLDYVVCEEDLRDVSICCLGELVKFDENYCPEFCNDILIKHASFARKKE